MPDAAPEYAATPRQRDAIERGFRPKRTWKSVLSFGMTVSAVIHLSAVIVFKIVIYFPREDIRYYDFSVVQVPAEEVIAEVENPDDPSQPLRLANRLPAITLPTLEFAELERLRVRQSGFEEASLYDELYGRELSPLERVGEGLAHLGSEVRRFTLGEPMALDLSPAAPAVATFSPARGYEGRLVWIDRAAPRALLFSPPMSALWNLEGAETLEMVLKVDAAGRVTSVWSAESGDSAVFDDVQAAVFQFRFEADDSLIVAESVNLIIRPESDA
jgi:hypothetical protein